MSKTLLSLLLVLAFMPVPANSALAFECPLPHPGMTNMAIAEPPETIKEYSAMLANGDTGNAVNEIIFQLRKKHPEAGNAEIANFLVTAYCPAIQARGYEDGTAKAKIKEFSTLVDEHVFHKN